MARAARTVDVRFGSKADILRCGSDVRFTPNSGHWAVEGAVHCGLLALHGNCNTSQPGQRRSKTFNSAQSERIASVFGSVAKKSLQLYASENSGN